MIEDHEFEMLKARVVELEFQVVRLKAKCAALAQLGDRTAQFLKVTHGNDALGFELVEQAAQEALTPD